MDVLRIADEAQRCLRESPFVTVHSVYRSTINLIAENDSLVCLSSCEVPLHPFSVVLDVPDVERFGLLPQMRLAVDCGLLSFPQGEIVDLDGIDAESLSSAAWEGRRICRSSSEQVRDIVERACVKSDLGFLVVPGVPTSFAGFASRIRLFICAALRSDAIQAANVANDLIGLGRGLTPSMDDFCVGMLAAFWRKGRKRCALQLGSELAYRAREASTLVSAEFLGFAAQGCFGEPVLGVLAHLEDGRGAPMRKAMEKLLSLGHSSGVDTAIGLVVGLELVKLDDCAIVDRRE